MRRLLVLIALLGALAGAVTAHADGYGYPYRPPAIYPAYPAYPAYPVMPYAYPPVYAPPVYGYPYVVQPPAFYFGSGYDPDYRAMRYNRYFTRDRDEPRIQGFTLGR